MTTITASAGQVALVVAAVVVAVAAVTWFLNSRRRDEWQKVARKHGLRFIEPPEGPRVSGDIDGRPIEIAIDDGGSDRDVGGVETIHLAVGLRGLPPGMTAEGIPGLIGDLTALAEERIHFEEQDFHRNVLVKAGEELPARRYWNQRRQHAFLSLLHEAPCDQVAIRDNSLVAELREIISNEGQLGHLLDQLLKAAPTLDSDGNGQ